MRENLNIFTKVQVAAPDYPGVPIGDAEYQRVGGIYHSTFMGRFGDAQIGPIYLGATGIASIIAFFVAFFLPVDGLSRGDSRWLFCPPPSFFSGRLLVLPEAAASLPRWLGADASLAFLEAEPGGSLFFLLFPSSLTFVRSRSGMARCLWQEKAAPVPRR